MANIYYYKFIKEYLISLINIAVGMPVENQQRFYDSLKFLWKYCELLYTEEDKFLPLNFQKLCFAITIFEKELAENKEEVTEFKKAYLASGESLTNVQLLGPCTLMYQLERVLLCRQVLDNNKSPNKLITQLLQQFFYNEFNALQKMIDNNKANAVFTKLQETFIDIDPIFKKIEDISVYYDGNAWENKKVFIIHHENQVKDMKELMGKVKQKLNEGFEYYHSSVYQYQNEYPVIVNEYQKILSQVCNEYIKAFNKYLKLLFQIVSKERSIMKPGVYKSEEQIKVMSEYIFKLIDEFEAPIQYIIQDLLAKKVSNLIDDIENGKFPYFLLIEDENTLMLSSPESVQQSYATYILKYTQMLSEIIIERQSMQNSLEQIKTKLKIAEIQADQFARELLESEKLSKEERSYTNSKQQPRKKLTTHKNEIKKQPPHNKKPHPKNNAHNQYKLVNTLKKEENNPPAEEWRIYYNAAKQLKYNRMFASEEYTKALSLAKKNKDYLLIAACCDALSIIYCNLGNEHYNGNNCETLFNLGPQLFKNLIERQHQLNILMTVREHFYIALDYINTGKKAISQHKPTNPRKQKDLQQIKISFELNDKILSDAQTILFNVSKLLEAVEINRIKKQEALGENWKKNISPDKKSVKAQIYHELVNIQNSYQILLNKYSTRTIPGDTEIICNISM